MRNESRGSRAGKKLIKATQIIKLFKKILMLFNHKLKNKIKRLKSVSLKLRKEIIRLKNLKQIRFLIISV